MSRAGKGIYGTHQAMQLMKCIQNVDSLAWIPWETPRCRIQAQAVNRFLVQSHSATIDINTLPQLIP
jgi:hypothetical protein